MKIYFADANLSGADLSGADLSGAKDWNFDLLYAKLKDKIVVTSLHRKMLAAIEEGGTLDMSD